tara:strand:- start:220 stop:831 length:612 start_codon:yes stop_codon:yes gene_type:complete
MALKSYKPRISKVKKNRNIKFISYLSCLIMIIFTITLFFQPNNKYDIVRLDSTFFKGNYNNSKDLLKIENATLVGNDKKNRPYMLSAESAVNSKVKKNLFILNDVSADITLKDGRWILLNTSKAVYDIERQILQSESNVEIFEDTGESFLVKEMIYDFRAGIISGNQGIVMLGNWGKLESENFTYNPNMELLSLYGAPSLVVD